MSADYAKSQQGARRRLKSTINSSDARRKREDTAIKLRKDKRIESFAKRRNTAVDEDTHEEATFANVGERAKEIMDLTNTIRTSGDQNIQFEAITKIRKLLSIEHNPPIQEVINAGLVPIFIACLAEHSYPKLQFEAAWSLTNVASGTPDQTQFVINQGALPAFALLLTSPSDDVREQAIWALGNIAGDSPNCRDLVLSFNVVEPLLRNTESARLSTLRNATWAISNLCRGKPQPSWSHISPALPTLCRLLNSSDEEVLADTCWALSYLSDGPNERIQAIIDSGVTRRLVDLLGHSSSSVQTPALRVVGNIVTGDDNQTQVILSNNVVPRLYSLLSSSKKGIRKEAVWTVSNITAGPRNQIQLVIDAGIIPRLINFLKNADFDIKKEAAWAISNATSGGSIEQIRYLVDQGGVEPMCELLGLEDARMVTVALEALENILKSGEKSVKNPGDVNPYCSRVEACGGLDKLENLQSHRSQDIYEKSVNLLETYFAAEDDQNVTPNVNFASNTFQFGGITVGGSDSFNF